MVDTTQATTHPWPLMVNSEVTRSYVDIGAGGHYLEHFGAS